VTKSFIDTREVSNVRVKLEEEMGKFNGTMILAESARLPQPQTIKFNRD
jgi:hypothetical protein